MKTHATAAALAVMTLALAACGGAAPQALGTLERDRITLPAPVDERIVAVDVREGDTVKAGQRVLQLERTRNAARLEALDAQARQAADALAELEAGPRSESIDLARARVAAARAQARDAKAYYDRLRPLGARQLVAKADVDNALAAADSAAADVAAAESALLELEHGTRPEQLAQGRAAEAAATASAAVQAETLGKLDVTAPRDAVVESLPYKLGDQAPVGAPLAILLVGDAPYARVYVPEPIRAGIGIGQAARVRVEGRDEVVDGTVRMIHAEPSFTPYYALTGEDAARLSYIAEIRLEGDTARRLPVGLPVQVDFVDAGR